MTKQVYIRKLYADLLDHIYASLKYNKINVRKIVCLVYKILNVSNQIWFNMYEGEAHKIKCIFKVVYFMFKRIIMGIFLLNKIAIIRMFLIKKIPSIRRRGSLPSPLRFSSPAQ